LADPLGLSGTSFYLFSLNPETFFLNIQSFAPHSSNLFRARSVFGDSTTSNIAISMVMRKLSIV
jgi:hypothetical protein